MKYAVALLMILVSGVVGCSSPTLPKGEIQQSGVSAYLGLHLITTYKVGLSHGRTLTVTSSMSPGWHDWIDSGMSFGYELEQQDDKKVNFDCEAIADKIIDAALVEEIRPYCETIPNRAKDFWKSMNYDPDDFIDERGTHWRRVKP